MAEASFAALVLVPLGLLAYLALHFIRLGMTTGELTDAARQRLAGLGMLLLYLVVPLTLGVLTLGVLLLARLLSRL
jgi:hypothetical protein